MKVLSAEIIRELTKCQATLLLQSSIALDCNKRWLKKLLLWCDEHEICLGRLAGNKYYISREGIAAIEQWLALHQQANLATQNVNISGSRESVASCSSNEKIARKKPLDHLILIANLNLSLRQQAQTASALKITPPQVSIECDISEIDLTMFDFLVVIENRDSFNLWHRYAVCIDKGILSRSLVVYRGHEKFHAKACVALKKRWQQEKGQQGLVYFGDFDIAGLAIAIDSSTPYQYLLLPTINYIEVQLDPLQYEHGQQFHRRDIAQRCPKAWQGLLALLQSQQAALRQQNMFNTELILY